MEQGGSSPGPGGDGSGAPALGPRGSQGPGAGLRPGGARGRRQRRGRGRGPGGLPAGPLLAAAALAVVVGGPVPGRGQITNPLVADGDLAREPEWADQQKFRQRAAGLDHAGADDEAPVHDKSACPVDTQLRWMREVSSSVYSTPLITDFYSDGRKDILVSSFVHYMEVLDGSTGAQLPGWPAFHKASVHSSPLLYDVDFDGVPDVVVPTYDGEILFIQDSGKELRPFSLKIPRLKVNKEWYVGLAPDHVDHSHPDVGENKRKASPGGAAKRPEPVEELPADVIEDDDEDDEGGAEGGADAAGGPTQARRRLAMAQDVVTGHGRGHAGVPAGGASAGPAQGPTVETKAEVPTVEDREGDGGGISEEAADSFKVFQDQGPAEDAAEAVGGEGEEGEGLDPWADGEGDEDFEDYYTYIDEGDFDTDEVWGNQYFEGDDHEEEKDYVMIDPHILSTPAIADIDNDGHDELVVGVSYFYDREYYEAIEHRAELGMDVDMAKYIASGIVIFDLATREIKASRHLDLSTDHIEHRAFVYSSPTLADLDKSGTLDIVLGTSVGFLYAFDHNLDLFPSFPKLMGEIQGQVIVADVDDDSFPDIVATDTKGNIAVFDARGKEKWERHLNSLIAQAPTVGDVDGDGRMEVVIGTSSGHLHVLRGADGEPKNGFPFRAHGKIMSPALITPLGDGTRQHIVFLSFDGFLYLLDGASGCADTVDIGETSYSMVLADDIDGNGQMDLIVSTMNGNVYCFETTAPYHPLKAWTSQAQAVNGFTARYNSQGIFASAASRAPRDVGGETLKVQFDLVDKRPPALVPPASAGDAPASARGPYNVTVKLVGVGVDQMNAGERPIIGITDSFEKPGTYEIEIPCPRTRTTATVHLTMVDEHRFYYYDSFSVSFHVHYYRVLKWLVALPFTFMCIAVLAILSPTPGGFELPSGSLSFGSLPP